VSSLGWTLPCNQLAIRLQLKAVISEACQGWGWGGGRPRGPGRRRYFRSQVSEILPAREEVKRPRVIDVGRRSARKTCTEERAGHTGFVTLLRRISGTPRFSAVSGSWDESEGIGKYPLTIRGFERSFVARTPIFGGIWHELTVLGRAASTISWRAPRPGHYSG
jgi:hypothetical protein